MDQVYEDVLSCCVVVLALVATVRNLWYSRTGGGPREMRAYVAAKAGLALVIGLLYLATLGNLVDPAGPFNLGRVSVMLLLLMVTIDTFIRRSEGVTR